MRFLLLTLLISATTFNIMAMDHNETLSSRIIKVADENVIVINRGVEDGISRSDHGKITHPNGFIARGIALQVGMMTSHWKIYRIAYPEKVSKDLTYTLTNINKTKIPEKYVEYKEEDLSEDYKDTPENELLEEAQNAASEKIAGDLPENTKDHGLQRPEKVQFGDKQFNGELFLQDLRKWAITLSAAPISFNTDRGNRNVSYTLGINNTSNEKYELGVNLAKNFNYAVTQDPYSETPNEQIETKSADEALSVSFAITKVTPRLSWTSELSWNKSFVNDEMVGGSSDIKPFGLRYAMIQAVKGYWNISWSPSFSKQFSIEEICDESFNCAPGLVENTLLRHYFSMDFSYRFSEKFDFSNQFQFAPIQDTEDWGKFDFKNVMLENNLNVNYFVSRFFNISFNYRYTYDITAAAYGFANEHIYTTNFNVNFEL